MMCLSVPHSGMFHSTPAGRFMDVNPALARMLGYASTQEMIETITNIAQQLYAHKDERTHVLKLLHEQGKVQQEVTFRRKDGSTFLALMHIWTSFDADGNMQALVGFIEDRTERQRAATELIQQRTLRESLIDSALDGVLVVDSDGKILFFNQPFVQMWCIPQAIVESRSDEAALGCVIAQLADPQQFLAKVQYLYAHPTEQSRDDILLRDGRIFDRYSTPVEDATGTYYGRVWWFRDITSRLQAEEAIRRSLVQEEVIQVQRTALQELSTPLIPIADNVVVMPLIGTIDSGRAQQVMETLMEGITRHQAAMAILDITGVSVVDTQVAQALVRAAQAVKLLGATVMLTGVQPQMAQTLVQLGVDLNGIITRSTLQAGIAYALAQTQAEHHRR
ncbi:MAG: PAS domain S-box protein [Chloroflexaceae bacterium]|nr:PAS domain S-box protein [Chloroflexaceae bacterium]